MIDSAKDAAVRVLRQSEKYTKTDMVYLTSGGFWLFLKMLAMMAIAFALSIAFANLLPPAVYGSYKYVFSLYGFLAIATLSGMGTAITRAVARGFDGTPLAALYEKMRWGVFGTIGSAGIATYYFVNGNIELGGAFAVVAIFLPLTDPLALYNAILNGKKKFNISAFYEVAIQAFSALSIALALFLTDNLLYIIGAYFLSYTLARGIAFLAVHRAYATNKEKDPEALSYGKKLSVLEIPGIIAETVETMLMWQFIGPVAIAVYAFAKGIPVQLSSAFQRIITLAFPKFAERDFEEVRGGLKHKMLLMLLIMGMVVSAYALIAPYLFAVFFPQYEESVIYSQLFALTLLFFPQKFIAVMFEAHAKTKALAKVNIITPIARIVSGLLFIPTLGLPGVLLAEFSTRIVNLATVYILYRSSR